MQRVHLRIAGIVQGVGFRWFASARASRFGIVGQVRNCADGAVEIEAEGQREALDRFIETLRVGPPGSRVDQIDQTWSDGPARFAAFEIAESTR